MIWKPVHILVREKIKKEMKKITDNVSRIIDNNCLNTIQKVEAAINLEDHLKISKSVVLTLVSLYSEGAKIPLEETCSLENFLRRQKEILKRAEPFFGEYFRDILAAIDKAINNIDQQRTEELGKNFSFLF